EDGIRCFHVTGVQTCALPILKREGTMPSTSRSGLVVRRTFSTIRKISARPINESPSGSLGIRTCVLATSEFIGSMPAEGGLSIRSEERRVGNQAETLCTRRQR